MKTSHNNTVILSVDYCVNQDRRDQTDLIICQQQRIKTVSNRAENFTSQRKIPHHVSKTLLWGPTRTRLSPTFVLSDQCVKFILCVLKSLKVSWSQSVINIQLQMFKCQNVRKTKTRRGQVNYIFHHAFQHQHSAVPSAKCLILNLSGCSLFPWGHLTAEAHG